MLDNLEIEIKKWNNDYSFSSEDDDKKRIYTIYSPELKRKLREIIFPCVIPSEVSAKYEGKNSYGDRILYHPEKSDLPDQLTLISRELVEQPKITDGTNEKDVEKNWEERKERGKTKEEWEKQEKELGVLPRSSGVRHYFTGWNDKGEVVYEGTYFKSETQSHLIKIENKDKITISPQIQEITEKEANQENQKETSSQHQLPPKK